MAKPKTPPAPHFATNLTDALKVRNRSGRDRVVARNFVVGERTKRHVTNLSKSSTPKGWKTTMLGSPVDPVNSRKWSGAEKKRDLLLRRTNKQYKAEGLKGLRGPGPAGAGKSWMQARQPAGSPRGGQFKGK